MGGYPSWVTASLAESEAQEEDFLLAGAEPTGGGGGEGAGVLFSFHIPHSSKAAAGLTAGPGPVTSHLPWV